MNSKTVLNKIMHLLSAQEAEKVAMTYAKLADGTIVESPTFDVGEAVEVVTEEGKVPAPDGEHELSLRDEEGNEVLIRVITKDGIITERENVELQEETIPVDEEKEKEMGLAAEGEIVEEEETATEEITEEVADKLLEGLLAKVEEMSYRIEELSSKVQKMEEEEVKEEEDVEMEEDEEELPKLDGAPLMASKVETKPNNKITNSQNLFLSKLYKNK